MIFLRWFSPDERADLDNLTIIRPDALYVRVLRTGDIREEELLEN